MPGKGFGILHRIKRLQAPTQARALALRPVLCLCLALSLCLGLGACLDPFAATATTPGAKTAGPLAAPGPNDVPSVGTADAQQISAQSFHLDTLVTITIYDSDDRALFALVFEEIARLEAILSATMPGSDPDRLAQNAGKSYIQVSEDTLFLIEQNAKFFALSDGAFACTVGPLISLWGFREAAGHYPTDEELARALSLVDDGDLSIDTQNQVMLKRAGMQVDFGASAKGYIADRVKDLLVSKGINRAMIDLGGNIVLLGEKPGGTDFRIGLRDPMGSPADYFGVFALSGKSLVSSGSYERFVVHEGIAYHHIIDAHTGLQPTHDLLQVTIIADGSADADCFSTTAFILGLERGFALVDQAEGIEGVFVTRGMEVYATDGAKDMFSITNHAYTLN